MLIVAVLLSCGAAVLLNVARVDERQAQIDESKQKVAAKSAGTKPRPSPSFSSRPFEVQTRVGMVGTSR